MAEALKAQIHTAIGTHGRLRLRTFQLVPITQAAQRDGQLAIVQSFSTL